MYLNLATTKNLLFDKLNKNLKKHKVIGVGETGLDFYRNEDNKINQIEFFDIHPGNFWFNELPNNCSYQKRR